MLKQHLGWRYSAAMMAAAAAFGAAPASGQTGAEKEKPARPEREAMQERAPEAQRAESQLPQEVRDVLASLDGKWTVEGAFFEDVKTKYTMSGTAERKWTWGLAPPALKAAPHLLIRHANTPPHRLHETGMETLQTVRQTLTSE